MRRSHKEIEELIEARTHDYIGGQASEAVYRASLKALGVSRTEIELLVGRVQHSVQRRENYEDRRLEASMRFVQGYGSFAGRGGNGRNGKLRAPASVFDMVPAL